MSWGRVCDGDDDAQIADRAGSRRTAGRGGAAGRSERRGETGHGCHQGRAGRLQLAPLPSTLWPVLLSLRPSLLLSSVGLSLLQLPPLLGRTGGLRLVDRADN